MYYIRRVNLEKVQMSVKKIPIQKPHVISVPRDWNRSPTWHLPMATGETYFHLLNIHPCRRLIMVDIRIHANRRCLCNYYSTLKVLNPNCKGHQTEKKMQQKLTFRKEMKINVMYRVLVLNSSYNKPLWHSLNFLCRYITQCCSVLDQYIIMAAWLRNI